jgi:F0F1-type ATP synthase epsilon subunit
MKVRIVQQDSYVEKEVRYIECYDESGNITILEGHAPRLFVAQAEKPFILYSDSEARDQLFFDKMLVSIERDMVTIIVVA